MKKVQFVLALLLSMCICQINAQSVTNYLKKKQNKVINSVTNRADKEVDKSIDKAVNKSIDKLLDSASKKVEDATDSINAAHQSDSIASANSRTSGERYEAAMGNYMKALGVGVDVDHKDNYIFGSVMKMEIEQTTDKGKKEDPVLYNSYFNPDNSDYGIEFKDENGNFSTFVFDFDNQCTLILMEEGDKKTGIATKINGYEAAPVQEPKDGESLKGSGRFKKTGRTKTINGYKCAEYLYEDDESVVSLWVTKDLNGKVNSGVYNNQVFGGMFVVPGETDGVLIQSDSQSKKSKEQTLMTVKEINFNASHTISTENYSLTGIAVGGSTNK